MNETRDAVGILTVVVIAGLILSMTAVRPAWSVSLKAVPADKCGIGILPFDSGSAGPFSYLAPAIESMVGSRLTPPERISVISPQELRSFLGVESASITEEDKRRLTRELGLSYFVIGKISQQGENPRVDLILLRADSALVAVSSHIAPTSLDAISPEVNDFCLQATDAALRGAASALSEAGQDEEQSLQFSDQPSEKKPQPDAEVSASRMHPARLLKRPYEATPAARPEGDEDRQRTEAIVQSAEDDGLDLAPFPPPPDDSIPVSRSAPSEVRQKKASTPREEDLESQGLLRLPEPPAQEEEHKGWLSWILGPWGKEKRDSEQSSGQEPLAPGQPASEELQTRPPDESEDGNPPAADTGPIWQWY